MTTIRSVYGIDGDVWSLEADEDQQFLIHTADPDSGLPLNCIPVDEHVLAEMWRASRNAAVNIVSNQMVIPFPRRVA